MAEGETVQGNPVSVSYRSNIDHLKSGELTLVIPVPTSIAELMGRVPNRLGRFRPSHEPSDSTHVTSVLRETCE